MNLLFKPKHYVIYIPGIGDNKYLIQGILVWLWRFYGVKAVTRTMNWADGEGFDEKLTRLLVEIDAHLAKGHKVSLVAASAGASAALNAFAARPNGISGVVSICGKIRRPESVSETTYRINPAFKQSMLLLQKSLGQLGPEERKRILNLHPLSDPVVPPTDTIVEGSQEKIMKTMGHSMGIIVALSIYGRYICRFLKQQP
jgi:pimeloyl-ACP methyl ester carboxylesterase